jgi:hypothetical protein
MKNAVHTTNNDGDAEYRDRETFFYLDFHAELPDQLFTPATRSR